MKISKKDYDQAVNELEKYNYYLENPYKYENKIKKIEHVMLLLNHESVTIFQELYRNKRSKWAIMEELHISEATYKRRKQELVYAVHNEFKKDKGILSLIKLKLSL